MRKIDRVQAGTVRKHAKQISANLKGFRDLKDQKYQNKYIYEDHRKYFDSQRFNAVFTQQLGKLSEIIAAEAQFVEPSPSICTSLE